MSDRPTMPRLAWNLAKAAASFVSDGCKLVSAEQFAERLSICDGCEKRLRSRCMHRNCGCFVYAKAQARSERCPLGKWP